MRQPPVPASVLVIDDDPEMEESLAMLLEDHGFQVLTAPKSHGRYDNRNARERSATATGHLPAWEADHPQQTLMAYQQRG